MAINLAAIKRNLARHFPQDPNAIKQTAGLYMKAGTDLLSFRDREDFATLAQDPEIKRWTAWMLRNCPINANNVKVLALMQGFHSVTIITHDEINDILMQRIQALAADPTRYGALIAMIDRMTPHSDTQRDAIFVAVEAIGKNVPQLKKSKAYPLSPYSYAINVLSYDLLDKLSSEQVDHACSLLGSAFAENYPPSKPKKEYSRQDQEKIEIFEEVTDRFGKPHFAKTYLPQFDPLPEEEGAVYPPPIAGAARTLRPEDFYCNFDLREINLD